MLYGGYKHGRHGDLKQTNTQKNWNSLWIMTGGVGARLWVFIFRDPDLVLYILNISPCSGTFQGINLPSAAELPAARSDINGANRLRRCPPPSSCLHPLSPRHFHPAISLPFKNARQTDWLLPHGSSRRGEGKKKKNRPHRNPQTSSSSSTLIVNFQHECESGSNENELEVRLNYCERRVVCVWGGGGCRRRLMERMTNN